MVRSMTAEPAFAVAEVEEEEGREAAEDRAGQSDIRFASASVGLVCAPSSQVLLQPRRSAPCSLSRCSPRLSLPRCLCLVEQTVLVASHLPVPRHCCRRVRASTCALFYSPTRPRAQHAGQGQTTRRHSSRAEHLAPTPALPLRHHTYSYNSLLAVRLLYAWAYTGCFAY